MSIRLHTRESRDVATSLDYVNKPVLTSKKIFIFIIIVLLYRVFTPLSFTVESQLPQYDTM